MKNREVLSRQLRILRELERHPRGLPTVRLATLIGASRPTVDRDLQALRVRVGVVIDRVRVGGEVWHRLQGASLAVAATGAELAALQLALESIEGLRGTEVHETLAQLVSRIQAAMPTSPRPRVSTKATRGPAAALAAIERALTRGKRLTIDAHVASHGGERRTYELDPIALRIVDGDAYLDGWALAKSALRTFKIARIVGARVGTESVGPHDVDIDSLFERSVKTWSGDVTRVRVRVAASAAWAVREYPLVSGQTLFQDEDGSVIVEGEVAGFVEASRWALSWGRHAEVLEPAAFRALVRDELRGALDGYAEVRDTPDQLRSPKLSGPIPRRAATKSRGPSRSTPRVDDGPS